MLRYLIWCIKNWATDRMRPVPLGGCRQEVVFELLRPDHNDESPLGNRGTSMKTLSLAPEFYNVKINIITWPPYRISGTTDH
jgi:hypothetical protein